LSRERRAPLGERLLAPFRVLAGGEELESAGATLLERACRALGAKEGLILLAEPEGSGPEGSSEPQVGYLPGPCWGAPGPGGRLGAREGDGGLAAEAVASARPVAAGAGGREAWCGMVVEGRTVGVLALRRAAGARFTGEELVAVELLATGAAVAVDRLRFLRLWSRKLEQADAAHSQLLRYADDLRTTFAAERRRAEQLREALDAAELAYIATVRALATAVEAKDAYTGGHLARVTAYGTEACRSIGGDLAATPGLEYAFLLHDLGKIGVPDAVLNKAGPLTDEEWALMREHPAIGLRILEGVPQMDVVRAVVYSHHERWDGAGYPEGLKGEQTPLAARVFAAVDAFDAITTDRPYRAAASLDEALHRLREAAGSQFAPDAVEAIHLVDRERLAAIQATVTTRRVLEEPSPPPADAGQEAADLILEQPRGASVGLFQHASRR
jgi:HD-GYP domain-containing protein (c-di-GMP phosphodiesterase class II)